MVLRVEPATEADCARAVAIEDVAYGPNRAGAVLFPGPFPPEPDGQRPRVTKLIKELREDPACRWVKVVDTDIPEGEDPMIAFATWYIWETPQGPSPKEVWGPGVNAEACDLFFGEMKEKRFKRYEGKPYVYLKLLHTHPDHQRRGAGSMLLRWGTNEADRLGLESYLEASPDGKFLYEKRGFKVVESFDTDFSKWDGPAEYPTALMMRLPAE